MLEVTEAGQEARDGLCRSMAPLQGGRPAPWLIDAVEKHRRNCHQVRRGAVAIGVFFWWYSASNKTLVVNAAVSLVKGQDVCSDMFAAIEALARMHGALEVEFQTQRRGLVEKTKALGYVAHSVVMTKIL